MTDVGGTYAPARPVGARCGFARDAGSEGVKNVWDWLDEARAEMDALWENTLDPLMTEAEHADARAKLKTLIGKATYGVLLVEPGGAEAAPLRWTLVELKPFIESRRGAFGRAPRLLRLYLGEPDREERLLLGLHVASKGNSQDGKAEQDAAIDEALRRAENWAAA